MQTWMWVLLLAGLVKLPIAALMLWIPFRYDESQIVADAHRLQPKRTAAPRRCRAAR